MTSPVGTTDFPILTLTKDCPCNVVKSKILNMGSYTPNDEQKLNKNYTCYLGFVLLLPNRFTNIVYRKPFTEVFDLLSCSLDANLESKF